MGIRSSYQAIMSENVPIHRPLRGHITMRACRREASSSRMPITSQSSLGQNADTGSMQVVDHQNSDGISRAPVVVRLYLILYNAGRARTRIAGNA